MLNSKFGIEIEFTGIKRETAAQAVATILNGVTTRSYGCYDAWNIKAQDGRTWKVMYDSSIRAQAKVGIATDLHKCELVSPILTYDNDMETLQNIVRAIRKAGGMVNEKCGIHIHLDGAPHTVRSIKNFVNIVASKNDLFYKALQIEPARMHYCKKMDASLVEKMNSKKPQTLQQISDIWYEGYTGSREQHYHSSRYHFLNLHSFFTGHHTVELRGFNSTLHAGIVRSYVVLALALNNQALTQKSASSRKNQTENEKFAMRTYLNRLGLIGEKFANCREHLCKHLDGCAAWRFGRSA